MKDQYKHRTREEYEAREESARKFVRRLINSLVFIFLISYGGYLSNKNDIVTIGDLTLMVEEGIPFWEKWYEKPQTYTIEKEQSMVEMIMGEEPQTIDAILEYTPLVGTNEHPNGGTLLVAGWDHNYNGVIDSDEVVYQVPIWNGNDGQDGETPNLYIGDDGYWYINDKKTDFTATNPE